MFTIRYHTYHVEQHATVHRWREEEGLNTIAVLSKKFRHTIGGVGRFMVDHGFFSSVYTNLWKRADDDSLRIEEDEEEDKDVETLFEELDELIEEGMGNSDNKVKKFAARVSELVEQLQGKLE